MKLLAPVTNAGRHATYYAEVDQTSTARTIAKRLKHSARRQARQEDAQAAELAMADWRITRRENALTASQAHRLEQTQMRQRLEDERAALELQQFVAFQQAALKNVKVVVKKRRVLA